MIQVSNKSCIRRLARKCLGTQRTRNLIAIVAIALTSVLFTSLFTIALSINDGIQQSNFRQVGGDSHGSIKDITPRQAQELKDDPLIADCWTRLFLGMPSDPPFHKSHVEVSYIEPQGAAHYFCSPAEGALPLEGTDQAATDTRVLSLLGVEPKIGTKFTLSFYIDDHTEKPQLITRTFTLSGWWEFDPVAPASHVLLPRSEAEEIAALSNGGEGTMTGQMTLDLMFQSARDIEGNIRKVLENHGYQCDDPQGENYLNIGVNWGYTGSQMSNNFDTETLAAMILLLLLIIFTGYLIIYNIFRISVAGDIRFYGLLKTIGTTPRQLKRIILRQALSLSLIGIPIGLVLGWAAGSVLTPVVIAQLNGVVSVTSVSPLIFIVSALFSLLTVLFSVQKPGRLAARVSPVDAVRYTEGAGIRRKTKKSGQGTSLLSMARANMGRSRSRTAVTVMSLSLALVLMTLVYTFTGGFDMDKYLRNVVSDFIVADASYFQSMGIFSVDTALDEDVISDIKAQGTVTDSGKVYGQVKEIDAFLPEARFRELWEDMLTPEEIDLQAGLAESLPDGTLAANASLYGMEDYALSRVKVIDGDIAPLYDPAQNAVAVAAFTDDYGEIYGYEKGLRPGDTVTLRYVDEKEYYYLDNGEIIPDLENAGEDRAYGSRAKTYQDVEYTVCAIVDVPNAISYRYRMVGAEYFVLGAGRFLQDSGSGSVMCFAYDTDEESTAAMEGFLADYTENVEPLYDYESKGSYAAEFEGFRNMFLLLGGVLSFIMVLVGILNFFNAILTGIISRKREFAVLQSVGMTGRQLKRMLVYEGLFYALGAAAAALALSVAFGPLLGGVMGSMFWFFTYRFTVTPILIAIPIFALLGALIPLAVYRVVSRLTIVERLRETNA